MSNTTKKQPMSVVKKMMIALVGGLLVGIAFLLLREQLISSGNEGAWTILNKILFQDITAEDGVVNAVVAEEVKQSWQTAAGEQYLKINKIVSVQAVVLVVILTVFVYIILKLKRNTKKHYEK